jgi:hypothetical protein
MLPALQDIEMLLARSVSDVQREAAALKEQMVKLKLEAGEQLAGPPGGVRTQVAAAAWCL